MKSKARMPYDSYSWRKKIAVHIWVPLYFFAYLRWVLCWGLKGLSVHKDLDWPDGTGMTRWEFHSFLWSSQKSMSCFKIGKYITVTQWMEELTAEIKAGDAQQM